VTGLSLAWAAAALVVFLASFVMGLTGFGIALVAMAFLPYLMEPAAAVVLLTIYAFVFSVVVVAVQLRRDLAPRSLVDLVVGSLVGTAPGVWLLASIDASSLNRLIGAVLVVVVLLEARRCPSACLVAAGRSAPDSSPVSLAPPSARRDRR
jgi:uncharacterized protein